MLRHSFTLIFLAIFLAIMLSQSCGSSKKSDDNPTPTPINPDAVTPSGWDGKTDWSGSSWEVTDE